MERKIFDQYCYEGLGFPIILLNVPMVKLDHDWAPEIDYELLERLVLLTLCQKSSPLKGDELGFIRDWFGLSMQKFGALFNVSSPCVKKWEDAREKPTSMQETTEKGIRLYVLDQILPETAPYRLHIKKLIDQHFSSQDDRPISFDVIQEKIAI